MHQIVEVHGSVIKSAINVMGKNTQQQSSQFLSLLPMQAALQTSKTIRVNKQGFTSSQSMQHWLPNRPKRNRTPCKSKSPQRPDTKAQNQTRAARVPIQADYSSARFLWFPRAKPKATPQHCV